MIEFWMVIALILTGCVVLIAYYFAMVLKEIMENLREMKGSVRNLEKISSNIIKEQEAIDEVLNTAKKVAGEFEEGFATIKEQILVPFSYLGSLLQSLKKYFVKNNES